MTPGEGEDYNFQSNEEYTYRALKQELNLLERHMRDGSYRRCVCVPGKHLPTIAGLASEGNGFAAEAGSKEEAKFMEDTLTFANKFEKKMGAGLISDEEANELRKWARDRRMRVDAKKWSGDVSKTSLREDVERQAFGNDVTFPSGVDGLESNGSENSSDSMVYGHVVDRVEAKAEKKRPSRLVASSSRDDILFVSRRPHSTLKDVEFLDFTPADVRGKFAN